MTRLPLTDARSKPVARGASPAHGALPDAALDAMACRVAELLADRLMPTPSPWLDAAEAAEHLRCGKRRVYDLVQQDRIPHRREGARLLFRVDELDAWVDSGAAADADTALTPDAKSLHTGTFSGPQRFREAQVHGGRDAA